MADFLGSVANAFANSNPIGAGVGLAFNSIGSFFQNRSNKHRQQEAFAQQEKMQALQNSYNTRMWHMSNEYNSPANQMRLMKDAGLNPNLAYGQMSDIGSTPVHSGSGSPPGFAQMGNVFGSVDPLTMAQARLANAQADNWTLRLLVIILLLSLMSNYSLVRLNIRVSPLPVRGFLIRLMINSVSNSISD